MAQSSPPVLSLIVPTRNEEDNVRHLVERVREACHDVSLECIFVDDSDDGTRAAIDEIAQADSMTVQRIYRDGAERRGGLSTAVIAGMQRASGTYVCVIDSDLQHPPETIPLLLRTVMEENCDLGVGSRYMKGGSSAGLSGIVRTIVSRCSTSLVHLVFPTTRDTSDPLSGFFVVRNAAITAIPFHPTGFKILLEILVHAPHLNTVDVPFVMAPRHAGESKASIREGFRFLRHVFVLLPHRKRH